MFISAHFPKNCLARSEVCWASMTMSPYSSSLEGLDTVTLAMSTKQILSNHEITNNMSSLEKRKKKINYVKINRSYFTCCCGIFIYGDHGCHRPLASIGSLSTLWQFNFCLELESVILNTFVVSLQPRPTTVDHVIQMRNEWISLKMKQCHFAWLLWMFLATGPCHPPNRVAYVTNHTVFSE